MGPPFLAKSHAFDPAPGFQKLGVKPGLGPNPGALCVRIEPPASIRHQSPHLPGLRVHQMRLGARKARHLDVSEYSDLAEQWEASASEGAAAANGAHAFNRTRWSLPENRASDLF
jgi:hypothetical protein